MRILLLIGALVLIIIDSSEVMAENVEALQAVADATSQFAVDFFQVLTEKQEGNLICSPLSAALVLSMAAYGARENTAKQMRTSLHLPSEDSIGKSGFNFLIDTLNNVKGVNLSVANKLYVAVGFKLKAEYEALTKSFFLSTTQQVDFRQPVEAARIINSWCAEKTKNLITEILKPDDVHSDAKLVLINAVYFKGKWANPFDANLTKDRPFHVDEKTVKNIPTMFIKSHFKYGTVPNLKAKFIELPYEGNELSMLIILPDEINGLQQLEKNLQRLNLSQLTREGYSREVELYLPKFNIETMIDLKDILKQLGMTDMFERSANFSGIADTSLTVDKVIQKALIEVNEEGSEAAAVTVMVTIERSLFLEPVQIPVMKVDRPFHYAIFHDPSKTILFEGHIQQPILQ